MTKKLLLTFLFVFIASVSFAADFYTMHYNLCVPEEGSRNWSAKVSKDLVSMDEITYEVSQDAGLVNKTNYFIGRDGKSLSTDVSLMKTQSGSHDTATVLGPFVCVSRDISGTVSLNFWDGSRWRRIMLSGDTGLLGGTETWK